MKDKKPLVNVVMITYGHEKFIAKAIEGVLMQQCDFNVELIIANDNSPDNTDEIIKSIIANHSNSSWISYSNHTSNKGMMLNFIWALKQVKGKYIALCEGDDYWTDPLKLQKEVDFLEKNKDVNIVHSDFDWFNESIGELTVNYYKSINYSLPEKYDIKHFFLNPKARTLTVCFRAINLIGFNKILSNNNWSVGDTPLLLYVVKDKKIGYINESTGVYRRGIETTSVSKNASKQFKYWLNASSKVKYFFYDYYGLNDKEIKKKLDNDYYDGMFNVAIPAKKYKYIVKSFLYKLFNFRLNKSNIGQLFYGLILNK